MNNPPRFDLEKALAAWRRTLVYNRAFTTEDLDELERHVRDQVAALEAQGLSTKDAFRRTLREMGDYGVVEAEYRKVYWGKRRRRRELAHEFSWRLAMLKNYFKIALRTFKRQKGYSFLNVAGLSVGLACAFLIALWIRDEVRYDRFHASGDRIYRVLRHMYSNDQIRTVDTITWPLARVLKEEYPEVEDVALITQPENLVFKRGELLARESGMHAGPAFFTMFSWRLIQGVPDEVLQDPTSVVISASLAEKYFGSDWRERGSAVGEVIYIDNRADFTVTGVFEDIPHHSSLQFDFVLPLEDYARRRSGLGNWNNSRFPLFVRTREGADAKALSEKIINIQNDHIKGFRSDLFLQPYTDQHLYSTFKDGVRIVGRIEYYVRVFSVVALIIVLIACINFVNLATARSVRRAREIGVRKAIGAERRSLIGQFMGESLLLVLVAFVLAIGLVVAALPVFNGLTEKSIGITTLHGSTLLLFAGIGLLTALIAGTYPALYLSSFNAVSILRGTFRLSGGSARLRQGLVVFQFAMSILLIVGTVTVYRQIGYIHAKNLGLDRENVIYLPLEGQMREQFDTAKEELLRQPGIAFVTSTNENPLEVKDNTSIVSWQGKNPDSKNDFYTILANFDFLDVMKIELAAGRDFDPRFGTDSVNYIINEKALEVMSFDNPLGERLSLWGSESGTVVGVVKNFHISPLYAEIEPTIIRLWPQDIRWLFLRTEPGRTREALASLEAISNRLNPEYPFEYQFLDESFRQMYRSEAVVGKLAGCFTMLALFIAGLGLFGLAAFTAQQRTKEIGVRKVLGATVSNLVVLLSKDFIALVLIAFVVTVPLSYFLMEHWLDGFAYRVEIGAGVFMLTGAVVVLMALLTVSYQAVKAALADPVKSLRYE